MAKDRRSDRVKKITTTPPSALVEAWMAGEVKNIVMLGRNGPTYVLKDDLTIGLK